MQPEPTYMDGEDAQAVAHNYLLALEQGDYDRAYSYLSPDLPGYPEDVRAFRRDVQRDEYLFPSDNNAMTLALASVEEDDGWATATVRITTNYRGGLFGINRQTDEVDLQLEQTEAGWKIVDGQRLFVYCWAAGDCTEVR